MTVEHARRDRLAPSLQRDTTLAAVGMLLLASLVGQWMATLLVFPEIGRHLAPFSYGRWAPLHLDLQLYGWCSLPAVGLLLRRMLPPVAAAALPARSALAAWAGALFAGAISWLAGKASGKLFLSWSGLAGILFGLAQLYLWSTLAAGWRERHRAGLDSLGRKTIDAALLVVLFCVPFALQWAGGAAVYPPVNPESGGATGHSLLASTLGVIGIALLLPRLFELETVHPERWRGRILAAYGTNWLVYLFMAHGNASNHDLDQILGLATLLGWPFGLMAWYRTFAWPPTTARWLKVTGLWAVFLVVDGMLMFLPSFSESLKFTNALVAHSHLAMAGLLTGLNMLILVSLAPSSAVARRLDATRPCLLWNLSTLSMVVVLTVLGVLEGRWAHEGLAHPETVRVFYFLRWTSGLFMVASAAWWFVAVARARIESRSHLPASPRTSPVKEPATIHAT